MQLFPAQMHSRITKKEELETTSEEINLTNLNILNLTKLGIKFDFILKLKLKQRPIARLAKFCIICRVATIFLRIRIHAKMIMYNVYI